MTHAELRKLALAATQGRRHVKAPNGEHPPYFVLNENGTWIADVGDRRDGAFVVATDPQAVLALLDELAALKAARDEACEIASEGDRSMPIRLTPIQGVRR